MEGEVETGVKGKPGEHEEEDDVHELWDGEDYRADDGLQVLLLLEQLGDSRDA